MGSGLSKKYSNTYGSQGQEKTAGRVRERSSEYEYKPNVLRKSNGTSNIDENASSMVGKFAPNEYGNFGRPSKNTRVIECDNPISESARFYRQLGKGGEVRTIPQNKGTLTELDDGNIITYRVITKTENSPAISINIRSANTKINDQKIHFEKREK